MYRSTGSRLTAAVFALLAGCLAGAVACAAEPAAGPKADLRVFVGDHNEPFNYEENGKVKGLGVEVAQELLARARITGRFEPFPWPRALAMGRAVANSMLLTVARTPERENAFYWIGPFAEREVWLWRLDNRSDIVVNSIEDAKKYKVATTIGDAAATTLLGMGFVVGANLDLSPYSVDIIRKMRVGRADLIPLNPYSSYLQEKSLAERSLEKVLLLTREGGYYLGVSRQSDPALVEQLETAFAGMQKDGTLAKILARWRAAATEKPKKTSR